MRDLAQASAGRTYSFPGTADRIDRILSAFDAGQALPNHKCWLFDSKEVWPLAWQKVLAKLNIAATDPAHAHGPKGSALKAAQALTLGLKSTPTSKDSTFHQVTTRSETAAIELIAATLASAPETISRTVIFCEDDDLAMRLAIRRRLASQSRRRTSPNRCSPQANRSIRNSSFFKRFPFRAPPVRQTKRHQGAAMHGLFLGPSARDHYILISVG